MDELLKKKKKTYKFHIFDWILMVKFLFYLQNPGLAFWRELNEKKERFFFNFEKEN